MYHVIVYLFSSRRITAKISYLSYIFIKAYLSCGILDRVRGFSIFTSEKKLGFFLKGNLLANGSSPTLTLEDFVGIDRITGPLNWHISREEENQLLLNCKYRQTTYSVQYTAG
jgi:hypothetical protein